MMERSLRLSNGPGPAGRVIGAVVGVVFAVGGLLFAAAAMVGDRFLDDFGGAGQCVNPDDLAGLPLDVLPSDVAVCSGWMPEHIGPVGFVGLVLGGGLALLGLSLAMWWLRTAAWLEGTTLRVRGAFRSRMVDLATADVTVGSVTFTSDNSGYRRVPVLVARDPSSGRRVKLSLGGADMDRLPPAELRALADAMTAGRPGSQADALQAASHLRQMADNPLDLPAR